MTAQTTWRPSPPPRRSCSTAGSVPTGSAGLLATDPSPYPRTAQWGDPASIQYTSGTTARPKAVVWSQANCLWAGQVGASHQGLGPEDVNLVHLPLSHTNALSYSFLSSLWSGGDRASCSRSSPPAGSGTSRCGTAPRGRRWSRSACAPSKGVEVPERHSFRGWGQQRGRRAAAPLTGGVPVMGWFGMTETVSHPIVSDRAASGPARVHGPRRAGVRRRRWSTTTCGRSRRTRWASSSSAASAASRCSPATSTTPSRPPRRSTRRLVPHRRPGAARGRRHAVVRRARQGRAEGRRREHRRAGDRAGAARCRRCRARRPWSGGRT